VRVHERAHEIANGLWVLPLRTPTLPPAMTTNTLVVAGERVVVIEPATPHEDERRVLDDVIEALAAEGRTLAAILVTHHHPDHIGYAPALRDLHGVPIVAHAATAERLPFAIDRIADDGTRIELGDGVALRAVFTPGHAPGHLVWVEERSNVAHAGDMVAGEGTILVDPEDGGDMRDYLDSLARLGALATAQLVPAHGPVLTDPQAVVDHYVAHRLAREAKVVAALDNGATAMDDVLAQAYADTPTLLWPLARRSLAAHLGKLARDGRVVITGDRVALV
jgi:ribonuclease/clavin/mitogillin